MLGVVDALRVPSGRAEHGRQHPWIEQVVGPELPVMATRECSAADRMKDREPARGPADARELAEERGRVRHVGQQPGGEDRIDARRRDGQTGGVAEHESRMFGVPMLGRGSQHLRCRVDADDETVVADRLAQQRQRATGAAAEIENDGTGIELQLGDRLRVGRFVVGEACVPLRGARPEELAGLAQVRLDGYSTSVGLARRRMRPS